MPPLVGNWPAAAAATAITSWHQNLKGHPGQPGDRGCLAGAGVEPGDLCAVQAHATGTRLGDIAEARALRRSGAAADNVPVFAPKGQLGHLLGAAGAVEAILGFQALRQGILPPSINSDPLDPEVELAVTCRAPLQLSDASSKD